MSNTKFWKPVYRLFKPDEPLSTAKELQEFYVSREDSPFRSLVSSLEMGDRPGKFLLAGHRGSGKTTELRQLQQRFVADFTVIWVDADTALERYNIGYAEVIVLIGLKIFETVVQVGWPLPDRLQQDLIDSLKTVTYGDQTTAGGILQLPKLFQDAGAVLKVGFQKDMTKTLNIRPVLTEIIERVNAIIQVVEALQSKKLLVIVDGLDRRDQDTAKEMFSSVLLTELACHIIYTIPIALRYSPAFRESLESFQKCLDLTNPPVFKCDDNARPTQTADRVGRHVLTSVVTKRLATLEEAYKEVFQSDALNFLCEKSGGVIRDLIRLARTACEVAVERGKTAIDLAIAKDAVREERKIYTIRDYHFPELEFVHRTGQLTSKTHKSPKQGDVVVCDELLQYKLVLGYRDPDRGRWFDINPILIEDLERWQGAKRHET